ncbi:peptidylprolyl isomerase [Oscillochloris sp. ZM17-4]|uniref:peptidylprolyl isomerase n=1 Tax=Oscillochloris sp. ZM17-4 TaxID=2866714 RepID=UPI00351CDD86
MSQSRPPRQKQQPPAAPASSMPGIVSAAVVLLVLGIVAGLLVSRAGSTAAQPVGRVDNGLAMTIDPAKKYTATIETPRGNIVIELLPDIAPQTVNNFVFLSRNNFYNGLTWHRVLQGFMAQGGDPQGDGTGGPGYSIPAEFTDKILYDQPGMVAMARSNDPDSAGSQFFITTAPATFLNSQYTIFGRVIQGQNIVDGIPLRDPQNPADTAKPGETILGITISEQ